MRSFLVVLSTVYTTLWLVSPIAPRWKNQAKAYDLIWGKIKLEQYDPNHPLFIVIASEYSKEIQDQLYSYGLLPYKDFLYSGQCNNDTYLMRYSDLRSVLTSYAPVQGYVPYIFAHKKLAVVYGTIYVFGGVLFRH